MEGGGGGGVLEGEMERKVEEGGRGVGVRGGGGR